MCFIIIFVPDFYSLTRDISKKMSDVRYIIDLDGFNVEGRFKVKEMAIGDIKNNTCELFHFKVGNFEDLNESDKRTALWVTLNITGLHFNDEPYDLEQDDVLDIIENLCEQAKLEGCKVAYKGGIHEKTIIRKLGYANISVDLQDIGCPKIDSLIEKYKHLNYKSEYTCSRHCSSYNKSITLHCSRMEVKYFMEFVKDYQQTWSCHII